MRFNGIDLNQLVALDALLGECSVTRAAERVFLSQSAMSWSLARLREHFGDPLLVQVGRNMILTPFAQSMQEPLRALLMSAQGLTSRRPNLPIELVQRTLRITASEYIAITVMAGAFARAEKEAPGIKLDLCSLIDYTPGALESGTIDLLIAAKDVLAERHPDEALLVDEYVGIVSQDHPDVGDTISMEQYQELSHVAVNWRGGRIMTLDQIAMTNLRLERRNDILVSDFALVPSFVVGTRRIATIHRKLALIMARQWPIRIFQLPVALPPIAIRMQWHKLREKDPVLAWLRGILIDQVRAD
ncbi:LysR family transcriptional regulator [Novosphingobium humi]|uniref:LysR family transcriptional regulator n=1 Tax=Novosphingobium humi TaxID=2282397 RepID=A0ABY7U115_9SPHN|nr:LysR family transcriptional regulator [Novosphingobium humi]WCT79218.1 LysR family transcriptional regulator [Novosphingobium humi]